MEPVFLILMLQNSPFIHWDIGLAGIEVYDLLRDEYDIQIEFGDICNILAYISIGDRLQDIERLVGALGGYCNVCIRRISTGMLIRGIYRTCSGGVSTAGILCGERVSAHGTDGRQDQR